MLLYIKEKEKGR